MSRRLYCGPYCGEFGFELCVWNPLARKAAEDYDEVIVEGPPSSEYLYEFATTYIPNPTVPNNSDGMMGKLQCEPFTTTGYDVFSPDWRSQGAPEMEKLKTKHVPNPLKAWRDLSAKPSFVADILFAFRPVKRLREHIFVDKAYPFDQCCALVELLSRDRIVACIGGDENYHIPGTLDFRGRNLRALCSAMAAASLVVGPSSGPMHLASLCKTPHVVWYSQGGNSRSKAMYDEHWNPFATPHTYLLEQPPSPRSVAEAAEAYL